MLTVFTYLITKDIIESLERKFEYQLDSITKRKIREFEDLFLEEFWQVIPNKIEKKAVNISSVVQDLEYISRKSGYPVVSLDKIYSPNADSFLEVTRITDPISDQIKIAARPGKPTLEQQIKTLKNEYQKIVLTDVGAFEGQTLLEICFLLEQEEIQIEEICLGFSSNEANSRINNSRSLTALNIFNFYEWIEFRDFFGIDGRNVGTDNGSRVFIPYVENLSKWASIPKNTEQMGIDICLEYNLRLTTLLVNQGYDLEKIGKPIQYNKFKGDLK